MDGRLGWVAQLGRRLGRVWRLWSVGSRLYRPLRSVVGGIALVQQEGVDNPSDRIAQLPSQSLLLHDLSFHLSPTARLPQWTFDRQPFWRHGVQRIRRLTGTEAGGSEQQIDPVNFSADDISVTSYTGMHLLN